MAWFRNRESSPASQPPTLPNGGGIAIVVLEGTDAGAILVVWPPGVEIGRGEKSVAGDGKLLLRDRSVSNFQARLELVNRSWWLEHNPAATNPTLVNNEPAKRKLVSPGDRIQIGRIVMEVRSWPEQRVAPPAPVDREDLTEMIGRDADDGATQLRPARALWGHLVIVQGPGTLGGTRFPLHAESITLGRAPDCDLVLQDAGVSRHHAQIVREGNQAVLVPQSKTNPTLRNGLPTGPRTVLEHGDEIGLADAVVVRLELVASVSSGATPTKGGMREAMEARIEMDQRLEREFVRDGTFIDVDIADSSGLKASETRVERVVVSFARFRSYLDTMVQEHRGRVLNSNGDEVMAFFDRAADAISCARALQLGMRDWNARQNLLGREFRVRIGVHTGRTAIDFASGIAYSPVLDVTGHLQKYSPVGGVLISATTHAELGDEVAGLEPGKPLERENMPTWVLTPGVDA